MENFTTLEESTTQAEETQKKTVEIDSAMLRDLLRLSREATKDVEVSFISENEVTVSSKNGQPLNNFFTGTANN